MSTVNMRTIIIAEDQSGFGDPIKFVVVPGDYSHLQGLDTEDDERGEEIQQLVESVKESDWKDKFPVEEFGIYPELMCVINVTLIY